MNTKYLKVRNFRLVEPFRLASYMITASYLPFINLLIVDATWMIGELDDGVSKVRKRSVKLRVVSKL